MISSLRPVSSAALATALVLTIGCASSPPAVLHPEVQRGPGAEVRPRRVLALSASCGSMEFRCPSEYAATVDGIVKGSMEFAGYGVIEPAELRAETRQRHETQERERTVDDESAVIDAQRTLAPDSTVRSASRREHRRELDRVVLDGPGFDDLTVADRKAVLAEAGADGVLTVRIVVGAQVGAWTPDQSVEVMVRLGVDGGETMAWASRCSASSNDFRTVAAALENAARCAVHGAVGE